jgi:hypothetical protein
LRRDALSISLLRDWKWMLEQAMALEREADRLEAEQGESRLKRGDPA